MLLTVSGQPAVANQYPDLAFQISFLTVDGPHPVTVRAVVHELYALIKCHQSRALQKKLQRMPGFTILLQTFAKL